MLIRRLIVVILVVAVSAIVSFGQNETAKRVDVHVKNVGLDSKYSAVVARLGKPVRVIRTKPAFNECSGSIETSMEMRYTGLVVHLGGDRRGRSFMVESMQISSDGWEVQGIRVGSSRAAIIRAFGEPLRTAGEDEMGKGVEALVYLSKVEDGSISFEIRGEKVVEIRAGRDMC